MPIEAAKFHELEYVQLRAEILKRIELRVSILQHTLTVAAALFGAATLSHQAVLYAAYGPIALCLTLLWAQNDVRGRQLGRYIASRLESAPGGWEATYRAQRDATTFLGDRLSVAAPAGTLAATQAASVALLLGASPSLVSGQQKAVIGIISVACLIATLWVIFRVRANANAA